MSEFRTHSRLPIRFLFVTVLAIAMVSGMLLPAVGETNSNHYTGCLTNGGSIINVAIGDQPAKPCKGNQTQISWNETGVDGVDGADGVDGNDGAQGADGLSAYDLAAQDGFQGTLSAWLASLAGADGADGTDGTNGTDGTDGLSCWDLNGDGIGDAVEDINQDDSFDALDCQGADGFAGANGVDGDKGDPGSDGEPCTVVDNGDNTFTMDCPGSSVTWTGGGVGCTVGDWSVVNTLNGEVMTFAFDTNFAGAAAAAFELPGDVTLHEGEGPLEPDFYLDVNGNGFDSADIPVLFECTEGEPSPCVIGDWSIMNPVTGDVVTLAFDTDFAGAQVAFAVLGTFAAGELLEAAPGFFYLDLNGNQSFEPGDIPVTFVCTEGGLRSPPAAGCYVGSFFGPGPESVFELSYDGVPDTVGNAVLYSGETSCDGTPISPQPMAIVFGVPDPGPACEALGLPVSPLGAIPLGAIWPDFGSDWLCGGGA